MADSVENRVVEMRFDNKDFETNAATSIRTLDQLDKALEFKNSSKGFAEIQNGLKNLDFSGIHDNISSIDNAFTSLAGSIERNFIERISNGILDFGKNLWDNTIGQIESGGKRRAINIEQAQFKIKGLGKEWEDVSGDIDYAVSGTAYGLDSAASAAAQFLASGVKEGEDMKAALRGISGVAAMTSSDYESISRVFTAAAGKGRVMAIELNRLSLRGINAAAAIGKYLGVTEAEVRQMASKGQIDFQTFANAMDSAFGEHAKKANQTFTGSLSNIKAALSRIGEIFYEPWIRNMIPVNNAIRESLNKIINVLKNTVYPTIGSFKDILTEIMYMGSRFIQEFIKTLNPLLDRFPYRLEHIVNGMAVIKEHMKGGVNTLKTLNQMMDNPWDFDVTLSKRLLKQNKDIKDEEWKLAKEMVKAKQYDANYQIKADEKQMKLVKEKGLSLEHVQEIVDTLTAKEQKYLDGITQAEINYANKIKNSGKYDSKKGIIYNKEMKAEMTELGLDATRVQRYLDKLTTGENKDVSRKFGDHTQAARILLYLYEESHKAILGATLLLKKLQRIGVAFVNGIREIRKEYAGIHEGVIPSIMDFINSLIKKYVVAGDRYKAIKQIAKGIYSIGELIIFAVKKAFTAITGLFDQIGGGSPIILNTLAKFGKFFEDLAKAIILGKGEIPSILDTFKEAFKGVWDSLKNLTSEDSSIKKFFTKLKDYISKAVKFVKETLGKIFSFKKGENGEQGGVFDTIIALFTPKEKSPDGKLSGAKTFFDGLVGIFTNLLTFVEHVTGKLCEVFDFLWGILSQQGGNISKFLDAFFGFLTKLFNGEFAPSVFSKLGEMFTAFADSLIALFTTIKDIILAIKDPATQLCKSITEILAAFSDGIKSVMSWITQDPEAAYGAAAFFAVIDLIGKGISKGISNSSSWLKKMKAFPMKFEEFLGSLAMTLNKAMLETPADKMQKFAKSLLMIAAAIAIMMFALTNGFGLGNNENGVQSKTDNTAEFIIALMAIAGFIAALMWILRSLSKMSSSLETLQTGFITVLLTTLSTAVVKIAIAFAIMAAVMDNVGEQAAVAAGATILAIMALLIAVVWIVFNGIDKVAKLDRNSKNAIKGIGVVLGAMGLAVTLIAGAIVKLILAFALLNAITHDENEAMGIMAVMTLFIIAIMGMLLLVVNQIGKNGPKISTIKTKNLIGIAVIMAVMGLVIKSLTKDILKIATFLVLTSDISAVAIAFGLIGALLLAMAGLFWVLQKTGTGANGSDALKTMIGFAVAILAIMAMLKDVTAMVLLFKAAGITQEDINPILALIATLILVVAAVGAVAYALKGGGTTGFLAIAVGILAIAAAIHLMADAVWVIVKTFIALSLVYPLIKDIIPDMIADMKEKLPEFIELVGIAFRELLKEILKTAPLLAAVIVEVAVIVAVLFTQKAPLMVSKWLIALDEIVTLLLVGAAVILPKLLALLLIFLGYLDANAIMLGERLTSILLKTFFGAFMAIGDFFSDFLPNWVEENFDKLNTGIIKYLSENSDFAETVGDWFYKIFNGQSYEEDMEDLMGTYIAYDENGKMIYRNSRNGLKLDEKSIENYKKNSLNNFHEEIEKANEEIKAEASAEAGEITLEDQKSYLKAAGAADVDVESISKDMDDAALKRAEEVKDKQVKSEAEAGTEAANKYADNFNFSIGNSDLFSGLSSKFTEMVGQSGDKGTEAGNAFGSGFMSALGGFDMSSLNIDMSSFTGGGQFDNATNLADGYANGSLISNTGFSWDPSINPETGIAGQTDINDMSVLGEGQTVTGISGLDAISGNDNGETLSMLSKLKGLIEKIGNKFDNTMVIPKDTNIDITTTIDKVKLGHVMTPVVDTVQDKKMTFKEQKLAK